MTNPATTTCKFCKETVLADAIKCKHCGSAIGTDKPTHKGTCPFCKEEINAEAVKCKHCKSMLVGRSSSDCGCGCGGHEMDTDSDGSQEAGQLRSMTVPTGPKTELLRKWKLSPFRPWELIDIYDPGTGPWSPPGPDSCSLRYHRCVNACTTPQCLIRCWIDARDCVDLPRPRG